MVNGDQWSAINGLRDDIKFLMSHGCAQREVDNVRISVVEKATEAHGRKLDKIYYTSLITAGGIIAFLLKAFAPLVLGK